MKLAGAGLSAPRLRNAEHRVRIRLSARERCDLFAAGILVSEES